ncbi:MAG: hypothetical protein J3Q66DRAFT_153885 [Benniella sp.]|nr:MAG: hypothetical protein J3Q66DRAFT_153885 [Benniella sp.]
MSYHPLPNLTSWKEFKDTYVTPQDDEGSPPSDIADVEDIVRHTFTRKKLLCEALTKSCKSYNDPDYERLEFLSGAVEAWIDQGCELDHLKRKTQSSVDNMALQAVCFEAGLFRFLRRCDSGLTNEFVRIKADFDVAKNVSNKDDWRKRERRKALGVVVESVLGAAFLDSGLRLSVARDVVRKIHWDFIGPRLM